MSRKKTEFEIMQGLFDNKITGGLREPEIKPNETRTKVPLSDVQKEARKSPLEKRS